MAKYYYDCPIKAAYMAKYFNVRFDVKVKGGSEYVEFTPYDMAKNELLSSAVTYFYVSERSESIFESKEDDRDDNGNLWTAKFFPGDDLYFLRPEGRHTKRLSYVKPIAFRDNKHFIQPIKV